MNDPGQIDRLLARVYKAIDIVIFVADAIVVGFLLFLIGTVALVGTSSPLYANTGGWLLSLIQTPGFSIIELLAYVVGALAVGGPIWHGLVRSSPQKAGSGASGIDHVSDSFEFNAVDGSSSAEGPLSGVRTANGGRSLENVRNSPYREGADWIESVFDESAQSIPDSEGATDRSPTVDALGNDDSAPAEGEPVHTTHQPEPGNRPRLKNQRADQSGSNAETSNRGNESFAPTTSMRQSSEIRGPSELIPTALSSRDRIQNLERQFEEIVDQSLINEVEQCIREKLAEGPDLNSRVEPYVWDSPAMDEAVAEIRAQNRRIDSAFGTEFGAMMEDDGLARIGQMIYHR